MTVRYDLLTKLPESQLDYLVYYPDILPFAYNQKQYWNYWSSLTHCKYLYTNGCTIQPTNWFIYTLQTFKGWLGLENHCQPEKVQFHLEKLAYYGYLHGYNQTAMPTLTHYSLPTDYMELVCEVRNDKTTSALQQRLITDYNNQIAPYNLYYLNPDYPYGKTLEYYQLWEEIPFLDPQNTFLIQKTIAQIEPVENCYLEQLTQHLAYPKYTFHPSSRYAQAVAEHYIDTAKKEKEKIFYSVSWLSSGQSKAQKLMERAKEIAPEFSDKERIYYIEHHLERKEFAQAFRLLEQLEDLETAIKYVLKQFTRQQQLEYINKNTPLASALAQHILSENGSIKNIEIAEKLDANFQEHYPDKAFILLVRRKQYDEAYRLFEKYELPHYSKKELSQLAQYFDNLGESFYDTALSQRENKQWDLAQENYLQSLLAKKKAYNLLPDTYAEIYFTHKRLYAQILIDSDINAPTGQLELTLKALNLLENCYPESHEEKELHKKALAKGLMRKVAYLTAKIKVSLTYDYDIQERTTHAQLHQLNFKHIRASLLSVIELLTGTKDPAQKLVLAQAHFTLADMLMYFNLDDEYRSHFKRAAELAPKNAIYLLRVSEQFPEEREKYQQAGIIALKTQGYEATDFVHWDEEHWQSNGLASQFIPDIHALSAETTHTLRR